MPIIRTTLARKSEEKLRFMCMCVRACFFSRLFFYNVFRARVHSLKRALSLARARREVSFVQMSEGVCANIHVCKCVCVCVFQFLRYFPNLNFMCGAFFLYADNQWKKCRSVGGAKNAVSKNFPLFIFCVRSFFTFSAVLFRLAFFFFPSYSISLSVCVCVYSISRLPVESCVCAAQRVQ